MYKRKDVARTIDHAVLKPDMTDEDLRNHARICIENQVYSMCVKPCDIEKARELLMGSGVKVSCVLSFPHGADSVPVKAFQAEQAIKDGTEEIDMVMNIGKFLSGDYDHVRRDIEAVVDIAKKAGVPVKVIQESAYLTMEQIAKACEIAYEAGADFVKTSTGFGPGGAKPEYVEVMLKTIGGRMKVKPSGGIRTWEQAVAYLDMGADRLGIGSTVQILDGEQSKEDY